MKRQDLVNMYKTDRSIKDSFKLNDDENYLIDKLYEAISVTRCCEELNASFKKGDVVLVDGKEKRIVVQEFGNGSVELESKSGWILIGKKRLELATKSV